MSEMSAVRTLPRAVVQSWLSTVRLPITAAEAVLRRGKDNDEWPPALAFASFEASVKQGVGSVLRDQELVDGGRLASARVVQLRKAAELETGAQSKRAEANSEFQSRLDADEQRRAEVEEQAQRRQEQIANEAEQRKQQVESAGDEAERTARELEAKQHQHVERTERAADRTRVHTERAALLEQRQAAKAQRAVVETDQQIAATAAVRRAKR